MVEKDFNILLERLLKKCNFEQFPHIFYNENGGEESIFYIKYIDTKEIKGKTVVAFAEIFGDVRFGYHNENNAYVEKHICPIDEIEEYLEERLSILNKKGVMNSIDKGSFLSDAIDIIISNFNKANITVSPELMLLITNAIAEAFENGENYLYNKLSRDFSFLNEKKDSIDFSKYFM